MSPLLDYSLYPTFLHLPHTKKRREDESHIKEQQTSTPTSAAMSEQQFVVQNPALRRIKTSGDEVDDSLAQKLLAKCNQKYALWDA